MTKAQKWDHSQHVWETASVSSQAVRNSGSYDAEKWPNRSHGVAEGFCIDSGGGRGYATQNGDPVSLHSHSLPLISALLYLGAALTLALTNKL